MAITKEPMIFGGWVKARIAGTKAAFQKVGLVSTLQRTVETSKLTLPDTTTPQGGEYDSFERVTSVSLAINFRELYSWVLALLNWGTLSDVPATTVTGEAHVAEVNGTIVLDKMPLTIDGVSNAAGTTDFAEFDDWVMTGSGIEVVTGGALETAIKAAAAGNPYMVSVDYSSADVDLVEALTNSGEKLEIIYEGENGVGSGGRLIDRYFICKMNPAATSDWINTDDYGGMESTLSVLRDDSKVGAGTSKYWKTMKERVAA